MNSYKKTLEYLYNLQKFGIKMGLEKINSLLEIMDNPHKKYPTVHIAGTNGKGSTSAMIAAILTASGYKTGLYTSPHLVKFNERIRINGITISDEELIDYIKQYSVYFRRINPTFFEATTAIAFKYFADKNVDIAVIETGMGGRLDATNVITPLISIITSISLEHTQYLGDTLEKIAFEKAGIIKNSVPCITAVKDKKILRVFRNVANKKKSSIVEISNLGKLDFVKNKFNETVVDVKILNKRFENLEIGFVGEYQKNNIMLALTTVLFLKDKYQYNFIKEDTIRCGLKNIKTLSGLRGRFELLFKNPLMIGDVAHNPEAFKFLAQSLLKMGIHNAITIFGLMKDKDIETIRHYIVKFSKLLIVAEAKSERSFQSLNLKKIFHEISFPCIDGKNVEKSIKIAKKIYQEGDVILITGSHYILGEAMKVCGNSSKV